MTKRVLVTTDLSQRSNAALRFAAEQLQARSNQIELTLVTVVEGLPPAAKELAQAERELARLAREYSLGPSTPFEVLHGRGGVATELADYVRTHRISELIIATHGRSPLSKLLLGSVAEQLVRLCLCPTFVVPSQLESAKFILTEDIPRILALTDLSPEADIILDPAKEQFAAFHKHTPQLILLHVLEDLLAASYNFSLGVDPGAIWNERLADAEVKLETIRSKHFANPLVQTAVIRQDRKVGDEIIAFAQARKVGLIVMGSHGRTGFRKALLGSAAEHVIRHTTCPVLVVPVTG